ncbi:MAG: folate hydrolase, partial [Acidobacteria bacterium]|nr:folate hydrolase [Acidobacteriota bacterium]
HTLEKFINAVARDIEDPEKKIPVWERKKLTMIGQAKSPEEREEVRKRPELRIGALGSGSDYTPFIQHLGVASLNLAFGGRESDGIYHSIYDDFYWYTRFSDTEFVYGRALAQTAGTVVMRLAGAELLPFDFANLAETLRKYTDELKTLLKNMQDNIGERNRQIEERVFSAMADPKQPFVPPSVEEVPPHLNFAPLENAVDALTHSAERYRKVREKAQDSGGAALARTSLEAVNAKLIESERRLTSDKGLPGRPWFKHLIYAPGAYTGYGVKTIPGVREAIEQKKWREAEREIARAAQVLNDEAALIESAARELQEAVK